MAACTGYYSTCSASTAWPIWVSSTNTATSTDGCWQTWVYAGTSSAVSAGQAVVWAEWSSGTGTATAYVRRPGWIQAEAPKSAPMTPEEAERQAELARQREAEAIRRAEEAKRKAEEAKIAREAAEKRARELLLSVLSDEQRKEYERDKAFHVEARDGKRYRLKHGWAGNIEELDALGKAIARYCIHPKEAVPEADNLVAQKLMLETDPELFRKTANRTDLVTRA